jgi:phosphopantetheine adenylyltransferase
MSIHIRKFLFFFAVNEERVKRGFQPLDIRTIEVISSSNPSLSKDELKDLKLSSTYLRELLCRKAN